MRRAVRANGADAETAEVQPEALTRRRGGALAAGADCTHCGSDGADQLDALPQVEGLHNAADACWLPNEDRDYVHLYLLLADQAALLWTKL